MVKRDEGEVRRWVEGREGTRQVWRGLRVSGVTALADALGMGGYPRLTSLMLRGSAAGVEGAGAVSSSGIIPIQPEQDVRATREQEPPPHIPLFVAWSISNDLEGSRHPTRVVCPSISHRHGYC
jgi:hypothetical protein